MHPVRWRRRPSPAQTTAISVGGDLGCGPSAGRQQKGRTCRGTESSRMTVVPKEKARTGKSALWGEAMGGRWAGRLHGRGLSQGVGGWGRGRPRSGRATHKDHQPQCTPLSSSQALRPSAGSTIPVPPRLNPRPLSATCLALPG